MQATLVSYFLVPVLVAGSLAFAGHRFDQSKKRPPLEVGGVPVAKILGGLGAKMEEGITPAQLEAYSRHFDLVDLDHDGRHSKIEYIEKGSYMTPQARGGIFAAADEDGDGSVSEAEYILNRIITDEGKAIMQAMDDDKDGAIQAAEFAKHAGEKLEGEDLAEKVFVALDADGNQEVRVPEYLRVWGAWARDGRPEASQRVSVPDAEALETGTNTDRLDRAPIGNSRPPGPPGVDQVFERFDADKDGKLSKAEIPDQLGRFILPADSNQDGSITKAELENFRANRAR